VIDDPTWDELLIFKKSKPEMELPEDVVFYFCHINPLLQELIEKYDLEIET